VKKYRLGILQKTTEERWRLAHIMGELVLYVCGFPATKLTANFKSAAPNLKCFLKSRREADDSNFGFQNNSCSEKNFLMRAKKTRGIFSTPKKIFTQ
jgi:hypothetical protein